MRSPQARSPSSALHPSTRCLTQFGSRYTPGSLYLLIWLLCAVFGLVCYQFRPMRRPRFACGSGGERVNSSARRRRHARRIMDQNYLIKTTLGLSFMQQMFLPLSSAVDGTPLAGTFLLQPRRPFCQEK